MADSRKRGYAFFLEEDLSPVPSLQGQVDHESLEHGALEVPPTRKAEQLSASADDLEDAEHTSEISPIKNSPSKKSRLGCLTKSAGDTPLCNRQISGVSFFKEEGDQVLFDVSSNPKPVATIKASDHKWDIRHYRESNSAGNLLNNTIYAREEKNHGRTLRYKIKPNPSLDGYFILEIDPAIKDFYRNIPDRTCPHDLLGKEQLPDNKMYYYVIRPTSELDPTPILWVFKQRSHFLGMQDPENFKLADKCNTGLHVLYSAGEIIFDADEYGIFIVKVTGNTGGFYIHREELEQISESAQQRAYQKLMRLYEAVNISRKYLNFDSADGFYVFLESERACQHKHRS